MIDVLLVLNCGSSSLKFEVFDHATLARRAKGQVSGIGTGGRLSAAIEEGTRIDRPLADNGHEAAMGAVIALIDRYDDGWRRVATVHRVVHGGEEFVAPVVVTPQILAALEALDPLAPLHQPYNLAGIAASARLAGSAPDIACFDTAFHAGQPALMRTFALERDFREKGIRRYGFHGISYEWISRVLTAERPELAAGRVLVGHLGNGASLCAMRNGASIDTTMGMTALDGLPMGTRSGALDPGVVTYMMRALGMTVEEIEEALYERSGLKGLSGISNDVRTLVESADPQAAFALDFYALKVAQHAAAMAVSMGGLDAFVFTGGIGENAASVRDAILARLAFLPPFETLVIPANEECMMAIHGKALLGRL